MAGADLHIHSTASDGRFPPREVVRRAYGADLEAIALTDHDTLSGIAEAEREAARLRMVFVPGCEISVNHQGNDIHLLAYYIDTRNVALRNLIANLNQSREDRLEQMVKLMREFSLPIRIEDIRREAAGSTAVGRLHIARVMLREKLVPNIGDAFRDWLGIGGKAYIPKKTPTQMEVIDCIWAAGGVPVLAHPGLYRRNDLAEFFADWDLGGIEIDHPGHSPGKCLALTRWGQERKLLVTGGSEWHGNETETAYIGCRRVTLASLSIIKRQKRTAPGLSGAV